MSRGESEGFARATRTEQECVLAAGSFRLAFDGRGDRWSHQIVAGGTAVAASFEWPEQGADAARVVSPVYQQLLVQGEGADTRILTVGQWGRHHFSGVFGIARDDAGVVLDVDVAIRTRAPLVALASTYLVPLGSSRLAEASPARVAWSVGDGLVTLQPGMTPFGPGRLALGEAGRGAARVQVEAVVEPTSSNHRLTYRWTWTGSRADGT